MEHEDLAGTHFPFLWEALSSDDSGSVSCSLLPELCSPEGSSSWLSSQNSSILLQKPLFSEEDDFLVRSHDDDHPLGPVADYKKLDFAAPGSPCSPLLFNFLQTQASDQAEFVLYGALHLQVQQQRAGEKENKQRSCMTIHESVDTMAFPDAGEKNTGVASEAKQEPLESSPAEHGDDCQPAKRRCSRTPDQAAPVLQEVASKSLPSISEAAALGHALNTDGKPRAKRGSATDPQSVYARHRRERINERLRTLQALVPNGGKVDIVTMLEEAINYVKFLQLQVKLLSSDDHWMYAPTTYNGMNISLGMHLGIQSFMSQAPL